MAGGAVPVPPAVVRGEQVRERGEQVVVAARARLDDGDAGRRVGDEQVEQAVTPVGHDVGAVAGQVEHAVGVAGAVLRVSVCTPPIVPPLVGWPHGRAVAGLPHRLALLQRAGSLVEDRGDHVVVRTPTNPTYYWGNFLLLAVAPDDVARVEHWKRVHHAEFPDAGHVSLGIDRPGSVVDDTAVLVEAGMRVEEVVAMTASSVHPPARPARDAEIRVLAGDADWEQQLDLMVEGEDDAHITRDFAARKVAANRELTEAGAGAGGAASWTAGWSPRSASSPPARGWRGSSR